MSRIFLTLSLCISSLSLAYAADPACKIDAVESAISRLSDIVKSSPAFGHAGGHYAKALKKVQESRTELEGGCAQWEKDGKKPHAAVARKAPAKVPPGLDSRCKIDAIEQEFGGLENQIMESPGFGHAGGHYANALRALSSARHQIWDGCRIWAKHAPK